MWQFFFQLMQMCPIYIEAVIQSPEGPQDLKEGGPPALECSQQKEWPISSMELWHSRPGGDL